MSVGVDFFADGFNRFDFVMLSRGGRGDRHLGVLATAEPQGAQSTESARTFRVFKMFRYPASLRIIGEVIFSPLGSFISMPSSFFLFLAPRRRRAARWRTATDAFTYGVDDPQFGGRANFDRFTTPCC